MPLFNDILKKIIPGNIISPIYHSSIFNNNKASKLAITTKRLDLCSSQIANILFLSSLSSNYPLRDKVCMEIGSGWVLSHALIFYLLGAKKIIATDIQRIASPKSLYLSIHRSIISIIRDILSPFEDHHIIRSRMNRLLEINKFSFDILKELGITYIAPIDLVKEPLNMKIDYIFSNSVLEHIPVSNIPPFLKNLTDNLSPEGKMIHCIHLEDHKDSYNAPFDFLSESKEKFTNDIQTARGNRIRLNHWEKILSQTNNIDFKIIYKHSRLDKKMPEKIDNSIDYKNEEDLRISHIGILGTKTG